MRAKKKNKVVTFIFSLIPGAGEMYMGFMRTGLSLMTLFLILFLLPVALRIEELMLFNIVVWFYCFFHANHLVGLSDEEFEQVEDRLMFGLEGMGEENRLSKIRLEKNVVGWIGAILIVSGCIMLWGVLVDVAAWLGVDYFIQDILYAIERDVTRVVLSFVILYIGIRMIRGRKKELEKIVQAAAAVNGTPEAREMSESTEKTAETEEMSKTAEELTVEAEGE